MRVIGNRVEWYRRWKTHGSRTATIDGDRRLYSRRL